jgi:hypothetical protein
MLIGKGLLQLKTHLIGDWFSKCNKAIQAGLVENFTILYEVLEESSPRQFVKVYDLIANASASKG